MDIRRPPIEIGNFVHGYNRGTRRLEIFHDTLDWEYFLYALFYLNDSHSIPNIFRELRDNHASLMSKFLWPDDWRPRDPLVRIHAYIAMPNHFHLLLEEIRENGISHFMQKFGTGLTNRYNIRYETSGNLFQGKYKYALIDKENYLQNVGLYVQVKNAFELYPGGFEKACREFDAAFDFACAYRFGSLHHYAGNRKTPIIDEDNPVFFEIDNLRSYKAFARSMLLKADFDGMLENVKVD
jgi:putative transposase